MSEPPINPLAAPRPQEFNQRVEGTWGEFTTPSGTVSYLMTNARLGPGGTDWERRLTSKLRPVREVLDVTDMDFDQLLQRDLDDYRVASELVPYLLKRGEPGPAFFPPILGVLLPFEPSGQAGVFPAAAESPEHIKDLGLTFVEQQYGDAFRVRRLWDSHSEASHDIRFGQLAWNEERAKVVVLDGQHRAMALLAIDRTLNNTWEDGRGARYRHFYEQRVREAIESYGTASTQMVQVPVTVCWFPEWVGPDRSPHIAARKLFVDVNREAKPPSGDRVVLLSDDDLLNILTRATLNSLRPRTSDPPLHAIEYDNPTPSGRPSRWSAIASLQSIRHIIERLVFGPKKYVSNVARQVRGRVSDVERDAFMREQLRVRDLFRHEMDDTLGVFDREELGRFRFPRSAVKSLVDEFIAGWGGGILHLFAELDPYVAHYRALDDLDREWQPSDAGTVDALAKEAIFEGVGMYWILRNSDAQWRRSREREANGDPPDVVRAWERVRDKAQEFRRRRCQHYVGDVTDAGLERCEGAYSVFTTQACQGGLALLLGTLCERAGVGGNGVSDLAEALASSLNASLATSTGDGQSRRLCLSQTVPEPLNRIADMNTARAVEFRYLWLEVLCLADVADTFAALPSLTEDRIRDLRDAARARYTRQLIQERVAERHRSDRSRSRDDLLAPATVEVTGNLEAALERWFDVDRGEFRAWAQTAEFAVSDDGDGDDGDEDEELEDS